MAAEFNRVAGNDAKREGELESGHDMRILRAIRQIIRAVDLDSRQLAARHNITGPQLMSLMAVVEKGEVKAIDISKRVHVSASTLVGVLDRLESKGLIVRERNAADRREVVIAATESGRALIAAVPFPFQYSLGRVLNQLAEKEREELAGWMERLVALMGAQELSAGPVLEIGAIEDRQE